MLYQLSLLFNPYTEEASNLIHMLHTIVGNKNCLELVALAFVHYLVSILYRIINSFCNC